MLGTVWYREPQTLVSLFSGSHPAQGNLILRPPRSDFPAFLCQSTEEQAAVLTRYDGGTSPSNTMI